MTSLYWIRAGGYDGHGWETVVGIRGIHDRTNASIRELLEAIRDETAMGANSFPASPEASAHRHAVAALATLDAAARIDAGPLQYALEQFRLVPDPEAT